MYLLKYLTLRFMQPQVTSSAILGAYHDGAYRSNAVPPRA
jgi:hypothetical protein